MKAPTNGPKANGDEIKDIEIERERKKQVANRQAKHLDFVKGLPIFHTSHTFMDYLHGDVKDEEAEIACDYEYARESKALWEAAKQRDKLLATGKVNCEQAAIHVVSYAEDERPVNPVWMVELLTCDSFPKKDWNELSADERTRMTRFLRKKIPPLPMSDVFTLKALRVFDKFTEMGEQAKPVVEDVTAGTKGKPMELVLPLLQQHESVPVYYAIFNLDFSKGETQLVNEFREWLKLPQTKALLNQYQKPKRGKTGGPRDRLRELAVWRLYREKGNNLQKANKFASDHRKQKKPFHNARSKKERGADGTVLVIPPHEADLFGDDAEARDAKASAWKFMVEIMPTDFAPPGRGTLVMSLKFHKFMS